MLPPSVPSILSPQGIVQAAVPSPLWVDVLVDCPGAQGLYTYAIPPQLTVEPGDILSVPFGAQHVGGVAIALSDRLPASLPPETIRAVEDVVCRHFFPPTYWALLQRTADYYCTPLIQVVRTALPPGLLGRSQRRIRLQAEVTPSPGEGLSPAALRLLECLRRSPTGDYTWTYLQRHVQGAARALKELLEHQWVESYLEPPASVRPKRRQAVTLAAFLPDIPPSPRQQEILDVLRRRGGDLWLQELLQLCQTSSSVVKTLEQKGYVTVHSREVLRLDAAELIPLDQPKPLTPDQSRVLAAIAPLQGATTILLHGVTGSGKTEVYLQAIAPRLAQGQSALVLVPEIGLTPQLTDRFRARFGSKVRVYHSGLSDGERYDTWRQMLQGISQVVIGTRSAIFAPLPNLGLIILDEEHDSSFKQDAPMPCYHARTVAQWRSHLEPCPLVLGSATPSLESWLTAEAAATLHLSLPHRIHARPLPPVEVVDMRRELQQGNRSIFSRSLQEALLDLKQKGQQGMLFIHRRGHSTFVSCRSCGTVMYCPHCDISLTYHQPQDGGPASLRCHYCGYGRSHPSHCPDCRSPYLKQFGSGTQRVVQELQRELPDLRCIRFDSDTTRTKGAHRALLSRFAEGEADVLVGTQMVTKGIDLPQVTLVGVIAADGLLHLADFRAGERTFQTLIQVAGRAGRGPDPGRVILQTYTPHHPVIAAVQSQNYPAFMATERQQRQELGYPPCGRLVLFRLSGYGAEQVKEAAEQLGDRLQRSTPGYDILGPAPAAVPRVARRYRWQILLKYPMDELPDLTAIAALKSTIPQGVALTIDVDPLSLF